MIWFELGGNKIVNILVEFVYVKVFYLLLLIGE